MRSSHDKRPPNGPQQRVEHPKKFVFFPLTWVLAHVGRTVEIAKELRARGHEVVFAGEDASHPSSRLSHAVEAGFRTVYVKEPNWPWAWERFQNRGGLVSFVDFLRHQKWAPLDVIIEDIIRVTREEEADLILGDASIGVTTAGYVLDIPAAGVLNAYNTHFFRPWCYHRGIISSMDKLLWSHIRRRVYRRHGVQPVNAIELLKETPLLSPDLPEFHVPHGSFPNWEPIGPLVSEPPAPLPEWFDELGDGRSNVYVTMGSTGLLEPLLTRCYDELGNSPHRFVVTTGGQMSDEAIAAAPDNFRFAKYAPGSRLLEYCHAMVFHGGNGTMYQGLAAGVPMVALPSHLEQKVCTKIVKTEGFGVLKSARHVTGAQLLRTVDKVMRRPQYRANAWRHRAAVRRANAAQRAADILLAHAENAGSRKKAAAV